MPITARNSSLRTLKKFFDKQVERFETVGLATEVELKALFPLLKKIGSVQGRIPFLIVVQKPELTLSDQMGKVILDGKGGKTDAIGPISDIYNNIPRAHYLAIDVEDGAGTAMLNMDPRQVCKKINKDRRLLGTVTEAINLASFNPEILKDHSIDIHGSRLFSGHILCLRVWNGVASLGTHGFITSYPGFGALSCAARLGIFPRQG